MAAATEGRAPGGSRREAGTSRAAAESRARGSPSASASFHSAGSPGTAILVSHTHWDRAWYCTFQEFRIRLVRLVDRLIELLEREPRFRVFMLDGQLSVLEDYLEVRPDRAAALELLVRSGRITVGPWYVLPDEFLVSPEALIRNLMLGRRMGERFGGVMKAGYVPDGFGHIAQLPQILKGFGMDSAFFWRGVGEEADAIGTDFEWVAMDGSRVSAVFMPWGYHNVSNVGYVIRWGDTSQMEFDWELALEQIRGAVDALKPMSRTGVFLLMNGIDHAEAEPRVPELIERANAAMSDVEIRHGTLVDYLEAVRKSGFAPPEYRGEFRWGRFSEVLQGVYSTRMYLKQENHRVENLLERYAEPLDALAWLAGSAESGAASADAASRPAEGSRELLRTAWKWLLKNHPHDDIYGSGIDRIHEEMRFRFAQARQIGECLVRDNLRRLARNVDQTGVPGGIPVIVFNPLARERVETATGRLDFDFDDATAQNFHLVDGEGACVAFQRLESEEAVWMETLKPNRKRRVTLAFRAAVPACGYATLYLKPGTAPLSGGLGDNPVRLCGGVRHPHQAENAFHRLTVYENGTFTVHDKATGVTYPHLHLLRDVEEAGDEYSSAPCARTEAVDSASADAHITVLQCGPCVITFRIDMDLRIPASLTKDRKRRSRKWIPIPVISDVSLYADHPGVYVRTTVDNRAEDHKLSVVFPLGMAVDRVRVEESFWVAERSLDLPPSEGWVEDPTPLMHQRSFIDVLDGAAGLAVMNRGLPSVEVRRGACGQATHGTVVALTLLRCVGWLSRDDLSNRRVAAGPLIPTPGAQCKGRHAFEYAVLPHAGDWAVVRGRAQEYVSPLLTARADVHEGMELREMPFIGVDLQDFESRVKRIPWPRPGVLPADLAFFRLEPESLVVTAVKRNDTGDALVLRFCNMSERGVEAVLESRFPLDRVFVVSMDERRLRALGRAEAHAAAPGAGAVTRAASGSSVRLPVKPWQVVTLELRPARPRPGERRTHG